MKHLTMSDFNKIWYAGVPRCGQCPLEILCNSDKAFANYNDFSAKVRRRRRFSTLKALTSHFKYAEFNKNFIECASRCEEGILKFL